VWANNTIVHNNTVTNTRFGIYVRNQWDTWGTSMNNTISRNNLANNGIGICSTRTSNSTICDNFVAANLFGIYPGNFDFVSGNIVMDHTRPENDSWVLGYCPSQFNFLWLKSWWTWELSSDGVAGIYVTGENSTLQGNVISNNSVGLQLGSYESRGGRLNRILKNSIIGNTHGINLGYHDNTIFHNNFINNTEQIFINPQYIHIAPVTYFINDWDNGFEGNYWSDYTGYDFNHDGIGDATHPLLRENTDYYPLMGAFSCWPATSEHEVQIISNSTIVNFNYDGSVFRFNVSGEDGSAGFCRVSIPTALMKGTYKVFINGTEISHALLHISNSTDSFLYFVYEHSIKEVIIVPEFLSSLVLFLFMVATLLISMISRRKHTT